MAPHVPDNAVAQRFDIYRNVHKGLRAFMADTLVRVSRMDPEDAEDVRVTRGQVQELVDALLAHIKHEDEHLHPALEACQADASAVAADDHRHHAESLRAVDAQLQAFCSAATPPARRAAALQLYRLLALLVSENLAHMEIEEGAHNTTLWKHYRDEEIVAIHEDLLRSVEPEQMRLSLRWTVPNLSHPERIELLVGMRMSAPPEVFAQVLALARQHLPASDWKKLAVALERDAALA